MFSGGIELEHWLKMGSLFYRDCSLTHLICFWKTLGFLMFSGVQKFNIGKKLVKLKPDWVKLKPVW